MADDDLAALVEACQEFGQEMSIRGSTAYVMSGSTLPDAGVTGSIVDSVPPLGDLDLVIRDENPSEAMQRVANVMERYRTSVPASRFLHVDVFYEGLPVRGDSPLGNVVIAGLPEVSIVRGERESDDWVPRALKSEQISASVEERVSATLFRDFLFLLRVSQRHRELEEATETVATLLRSKSPVLARLRLRPTRHVRLGVR